MDFTKEKMPPVFRRNNRDCYLDPVRQKLIYITPEETVRQQVIQWLLRECEVPADMIRVEEHLSHYGIDTRRRADIIVDAISTEDHLIHPLVVIECKAPGTLLGVKTSDQMVDYSDKLGCYYMVMTNGVETFCYHYDEKTGDYQPVDGLPPYEKILQGAYTYLKPLEIPERLTWKEIMDEKGFSAPYGLTTAERRHPEFRTRGVGKCEWDGAIWPFASAQTLTAMANFMNNYPQTVLSDSVYFRQMELYVESQYHRGRPYIGEYLDEVTGYWLKGDQERSRYYNHSTFNDLIITGLIGLRPRLDNTIEVNPLIPADKWEWFCLDNVLYHGHNLTILWDKNGDRYHCGKGLRIFVDGKEVGQADTLTKIVCENALK